MRERAVRRLLVCDNDRKLVGMVSLGDLADADRPQLRRSARSASAAPNA